VRSRRKPRVPIALFVLALLAAVPREISAAQPTKSEIKAAIEAVKADPNLRTERTIKTLQWKQSPSKTRRMPAWMTWIAGLFAWIGESTRLLIWIAAGGLAGLLVVYLTRIAGTRLAASEDDTFVIPTHVRDLDIRPETLPADIGAAARQLWEHGEQRAALALLYRGMLSRLAHVHGVPIRDSSTEGDCLALATAHLPEDRSEYPGRLVRLWQRFGYGRESVESSDVYYLCDEFDTAMRARTA
jgi:hypothetical protein